MFCLGRIGYQGEVYPKEATSTRAKVPALTDALGTSIFNAVPEVSVTRLDPIRLEELALLCLGSIEEAKIKVILAKMSAMGSLI